jgi:mevalonyl-CoA ligase
VGHRLGFVAGDILCCCPPLFHCFGLVCGILAAISHGSTVILPSDVFNAESSLRAIAEEGCTAINAVPTMFEAMLNYRHVGQYAPKFRLRTGIIAGSSLSETLLQRLAAEFGLSGLAYAFGNSYRNQSDDTSLTNTGAGMTELSAVSFMTTPSETSLLDDRSSVGKLMPHTAAKIVDSELKDLPFNTRGELLVSGYLVFKGYYKNAEKTNEVLVRDSRGRQWLRTGDMATLDALGACMVVGRLKDLIKRGKKLDKDLVYWQRC